MLEAPAVLEPFSPLQNSEELLHYLDKTHGPNARFLTAVTQIGLEKITATGVFRTSPLIHDHMPDHPIVQGCLLGDAMLQAAIILGRHRIQRAPRKVLLNKIRNFVFAKTLEPNEPFVVDVMFQQMARNLHLFTATMVTPSGELIARGMFEGTLR